MHAHARPVFLSFWIILVPLSCDLPSQTLSGTETVLNTSEYKSCVAQDGQG